MDLLTELRPTGKPTVMELVAQAGLGVSDWKNFEGGPARASTNPKYCYEWCLEQQGIIVLNIWYESMEVDQEGLFQRLNVRTDGKNLAGVRKARAERFEAIARKAFETGSNPRGIILDREQRVDGSASARMLDKAPWTVAYCNEKGELELRRGIRPAARRSGEVDDPELASFAEGQLRQAFVRHRRREGRLRRAKLESFMREHGRIFCEVPGCGFDFGRTYGAIGDGFAEAHHLDPLSEVPDEGRLANPDRLALVCSNCHRMIHRGGKCRPIDTLLGRSDDVP